MSNTGGQHQHDLLRTPQEVDTYVDEIARCADGNRQAFGFLPSASYAEAAARGRLWILVEHGTRRLAAYLFFGGRFPNISVTQLYVCPAARTQKLATRLITELKKDAAKRGIQTISARVAADLAANRFWERSGFAVVRQVPGGQATDRLINVRLYEVPDSSLWPTDRTEVDSARALFVARAPSVVPNYVLDLNVFFDLVRDRPDTEYARAWLGAALAARLQIRVTAEFMEELLRHATGVVDPVLMLARSLPTLPKVPSSLLAKLVEELKRLVFPEANRSQSRKANDRSDLLHLATCIHHRASAFVTREKAILRRAADLERLYGLEVVSPADLLHGDAPGLDTSPLLSIVGKTGVHIRTMAEEERAKVEALLRATFATSAKINEALDPGSSHFERTRWVALDDGGRVTAFCSYGMRRTDGAQLEVSVVVDESSGAAQYLIDHFLQRVAGEQPIGKPCLVVLEVPEADEVLVKTAMERGYVLGERDSANRSLRLNRVGFRDLIRPVAWEGFRRKLTAFGMELPRRPPTFLEATNTGVSVQVGQAPSSPRLLDTLEKFFAPLLLVLDGRPGTLVPIREDFARELLHLPTHQLPLLPGREARLSMERAYFGRPGLERAFDRNGLVIFYVSGASNGRKEAVSVARITFAGQISLEQARNEFSRYGVLEHQTFEEIANAHGMIGMFSFDSVVHFSVPISYRRLFDMGCIGGANLVTAQRLDAAQLERIIAAGCERC